MERPHKGDTTVTPGTVLVKAMHREASASIRECSGASGEAAARRPLPAIGGLIRTRGCPLIHALTTARSLRRR